jgi:hypothetical protein
MMSALSFNELIISFIIAIANILLFCKAGFKNSPELEMKKLLAKGSGDIYQICQVFRNNEQGAQNSWGNHK